MALSMIQFQKT